MKTCLVSLDLRHPISDYPVLEVKLQKLGCVRLQTHLWATVEATPASVIAAVLPCLSKDDGVFASTHDPDIADYASHNPKR